MSAAVQHAFDSALHAAYVAERAFLLAMLAASTVGSTAMSLEWSNGEMRMFSCCMIGGTIGVLISISTFGAKDVTAMSRQATANIGLATIIGPFATEWTARLTGYPLTVYLTVAVSGAIGIGGISVLYAVGPEIVKSLVGIVPRIIDHKFSPIEPEKTRQQSHNQES